MVVAWRTVTSCYQDVGQLWKSFVFPRRSSLHIDAKTCAMSKRVLNSVDSQWRSLREHFVAKQTSGGNHSSWKHLVMAAKSQFAWHADNPRLRQCIRAGRASIVLYRKAEKFGKPATALRAFLLVPEVAF